jgi:hypothetical protein
MVGWLWDRWMTRPMASTLRLHGAVWGALAVLIAVAVLLPLRPRLELAVLVPPTLATKLLLVGLLVAAAALTVIAARAGRPLAMFLTICIPMALVLAYETPIFVAGHNRTYDIRALAERLAQRATPSTEFITYRYQALALQFYTGRTVKRARDAAELTALVSSGRPVYVVAEERGWRELGDVAGRTWTAVDQAHVDGRWVSARVPGERR